MLKTDSRRLRSSAGRLSTRTGRLYKGLTLGSQISTETWAHQDARKWAGYFNIGGEVKDGHAPEEVEQGIYAELEKLKAEEVPPDELQKVKNNFAANEYRKLSSNSPILMQLLHYDGMGDWRTINEGNAGQVAFTDQTRLRLRLVGPLRSASRGLSCPAPNPSSTDAAGSRTS